MKKLTRRNFLKGALITGAGMAVPLKFTVPRAYAFEQSPVKIRKFVTGLPGLGQAGANEIGQYIPVATGAQINFQGVLTDVYHLTAKQYTERMHPDLGGLTTLRGYSEDGAGGIGTGPNHYLGPIVVAARGRPILFYVSNRIPAANILPIDPTLPAAEMKTVGQLPYNRIATHLHGGFTPWFSDGTPFQWFTPAGMHGSSFFNVPGTTPPIGTATYYYPNDQSARLAWYHDHAMGITRTNAYSGIAAGYLITDDLEQALINAGTLPGIGVPLIIQEKSFTGSGKLWYPNAYEKPPVPDFSTPNPVGKGRWDWGPVSAPPMMGKAKPLPGISCVPEAFLDTAMVNGTPYPVLDVTDKRYRFRILNGSQARFWHLNLYLESATVPGEADPGSPGPAMYQIGTEGGFLPAPVTLPNGRSIPLVTPYPIPEANPAGPFNLLLAPAERADIIIDFAGLAGASLILYNDAPSPFPAGDARNEYFTGDMDMKKFGGAPTTKPGHGPNTRTIMKINVTAGPADAVPTATILQTLTTALRNNFLNGGQQTPLLYFEDDTATPGPVPYAGVVNRKLTLNEDFDEWGRLIQTIGTDIQDYTNNQGLPTWSKTYMDPVTEAPFAGSTEVWELYNLTGDVHPIHFHLVNVQVIQRAQFDTSGPIFAPIPGTERAPDANELGWKETVRMNPGEVTTVIMKFDLPVLPAGMGDPVSPRTGGHEYVYHCHILEHEEHDMMRPLIVR